MNQPASTPTAAHAQDVSWQDLKAMILGYGEHLRESDRRLAELREQLERELKASRDERERQHQAANEERERRLQAANEERERRLQAANEERERRLQAVREEGERELKAAREERERMLAHERALSEQSRRDLDRRIAALGQQIAGLGDKFGYFAEGMALPSMERLLIERFGMETIAPRQRVRRHGREQEYDVLASANGSVNLVVIVEVKSRVRPDAIEQLIDQLETLPLMLPEFGQRARIGILAGVDWDAGVREQAQAAGLYTAHIHDELFDLTTPADFQPRRWGG